MDIDARYDRTFFRAASEDRNTELLRGNLRNIFNRISVFIFSAPRVDRHVDAKDQYFHPNQDRTIDEHHPPQPKTSDLPPLPMPSMDITTSAPSDQFSIDALTFLKNSIDKYPIHGYLIITNLFSSKFN
jgi:hypothetical protein